VRLLFASNNRHKLAEIRACLTAYPVELLAPDDLGISLDVVEDGADFRANAAKKAAAFHLASGLPVLADDSGLTVGYLSGAPGVFSARYAGPDADDDANMEKLLAALDGVPPEQRGAAFVCVLAYQAPGAAVRFFEGKLTGRILSDRRGTHGFGYDPLFLVEGTGRALAELTMEEKNRLSHRARALAAFVAFLERGVGDAY
jgi:XTP/dITP diphosphohydrolase